MSMFEPESFLDATTTEAGEKRDPLPMGVDFVGEITDVKARKVRGTKDPTQEYLFLDYPIVINLKEEYPDYSRRLGIDKLTLRHSASVDLTETGAMDWGKGRNNALRVLREATGTNIPGEAWTPRHLVGRRVKLQVKHREFPEGSGNMIEDVKQVGKA